MCPDVLSINIDFLIVKGLYFDLLTLLQAYVKSRRGRGGISSGLGDPPSVKRRGRGRLLGTMCGGGDGYINL